MSDYRTYKETQNCCEHGYFTFCPYGCFREQDSEVVQTMQAVIEKNPSSEKQLIKILRYKQAEARQLAGELSDVLQEIAKLEADLAQIRQGNQPRQA